MDRNGSRPRMRTEIARFLLWPFALCLSGAIGTDPVPSPGGETGRARWLDVTVTGGTENLVLWAPDSGMVALDSTNVPGAEMYRADGQMPGVEATVVAIDGPLDGTYRITGAARDSTLLGLEVTGGIVAGRCNAAVGVIVKAGEEFEWTVEYEAIGTDSCRVAIVDW